MAKKGRVENFKQKLTDEQRDEIARLLADGKLSIREIGVKFDISDAQVYRYRRQLRAAQTQPQPAVAEPQQPAEVKPQQPAEVKPQQPAEPQTVDKLDLLGSGSPAADSTDPYKCGACLGEVEFGSPHCPHCGVKLKWQ